MTKIRDHFRNNDITQVGTFTVEVYATPKNSFWMSPAYGEDVIKYDMFWFPLNKGNPATDFYPQFWKLLKEFDFRPHWGKFLPDNATELKVLYPRWDDFMKLRDQMDPHQIFVTGYWRGHLGILPA
jgi:D-arabinono-1,4-lactone oxidase